MILQISDKIYEAQLSNVQKISEQAFRRIHTICCHTHTPNSQVL